MSRLALAQASRSRLPTCREEAPIRSNEITLRAGYRARLVAPLICVEKMSSACW